MRKLTIYRRFLTRSKCYAAGTIQRQRGVQVHSTGANNPNLRRYVQPDDGRLGKNPNNNSHNNPKGDVCASAYIGYLADGTVAVFQTLPWDMRCWLSGQGKNGNANRMGYIGFEICEDSCENAAYFQDAVMEKSVLLTAHLCQMLGVDPWTVVKQFDGAAALSVMDHAELHRIGCASNHGDIGLWLRRYGLTMEDFRLAVDEAMEEGVEAEYVDCEEANTVQTLSKGDSGAEVKRLQNALLAAGMLLPRYGADGKFGNETLAAVMSFQGMKGLKETGVCDAATWAALEEAAARDAPAAAAEPGQDSGEAEPAPDDPVSVPRLKLMEIRACLADALNIVNNALGGDSVG